MYIRSILPIGALFSGSLILSNMAYLSLSVAFIQMLKVRGPPLVSLRIRGSSSSPRNLSETGLHPRRDPAHLVHLPSARYDDIRTLPFTSIA